MYYLKKILVEEIIYLTKKGFGVPYTDINK